MLKYVEVAFLSNFYVEVVSVVSFSWLYAYFKSKTVTFRVPTAFAETIQLTSSINSSTFGIWYLFLNSCLLIGFASSANLIEASFFTTMIMGAMKQSLAQFFNMPVRYQLLNLFFLFSCTCIGIRLPFSWIGHSVYLNFVLSTWCIDRPWRPKRSFFRKKFFFPDIRLLTH